MSVQEKASEWGVTERYIQSLCRQGKVIGAVKQKSTWLIPSFMSNPVKNIKPENDFIGTKKNIFESAVKLFMLNGFENVSVKDIANDVGIRQSAIYNHFTSKNEILDTIYEFYLHHFNASRPTLEELEPLLKAGSLLEIITYISQSFFEEEIIPVMLNITKIISHRKYIDEQAKKISLKLTVDEATDFFEDVFKRLVELGRIAPIDTYAMAIFINCFRLYLVHVLVSDSSPERIEKTFQDQTKIYNYLTGYLSTLSK